MLYVISKTQQLDQLFFVKADSSEEAHKMVGIDNDIGKHRILTDNDVRVLQDNEVVLIRA